MSSPSATAGQNAVDAARADQLAVDDLLQQRLRVGVEVARRFAVLRVLEDRREAPLQLPRREEVGPVDVLRDLLERDVVQEPPPDERRRRGDVVVPVVLQPVGPRLLVGEQRLLAARLVLLADLVLRFAVALHERAAAVGAHERCDDVDDARRVEHVHGRLRVLRRDLHRRVLPAGRRAADEQRQLHLAPLHLARHARPSRRATA